MDHVAEVKMTQNDVAFAVAFYQLQKCVIVQHQVKSLVWILCVPQNSGAIIPSVVV